jgi:simple sugar transport system substrate-binding protein
MWKTLVLTSLLITLVVAVAACGAPAPAPAGDSAALAEAEAKLAAVEAELAEAKAKLAESGAADTAEESGEKPKITFIIYTAADVEFFVPTVKGVEEAAELFGVDVDIQYGDGDPIKQNDLLEAAIANQVDGIAVSIPDDDAYDEVICKAMEAGIPVVSFNNDDSEGAAGNCRMAYMGQDMEATGYVIAKRMIEEHGIGEGDLVFTPVEWPEAIYASLRQNGVNRALDEVGAVSETVGTTSNPADAQTAMVQYLLGHPETTAIIALGLTPNTVAAAAVDEAGLGDIPIGGFDLSMDIVDGLKSGRLTATVDQQPYSQGFFPIAQLVLAIKYGLYPSDMDTGGLGLVDGSNVDTVAPLVGEYR